MPEVDGKKFPYTKKGEKAAALEAKKKGVAEKMEKSSPVTGKFDKHLDIKEFKKSKLYKNA